MGGNTVGGRGRLARAVGLGVLAFVVLGLGGCMRHQSQVDTLRAETHEVAPESGGAVLAEVSG